MKRHRGLVGANLLLLVLALVEVRAVTAQGHRGTLAYNDGSRYEGEIRNGRRHGWGIYIWPDGGRFVGQWSNDRRYGRGTRTWPNGHRYEGEWRDGRISGQGTYSWPNGERYSGLWRDGRKQGRGTYTWPDGGRYEGGWQNDREHGQGTRRWPNGARYVGAFRHGRRTGQGTYTWPDGARYTGGWRNGRKHGRGTYTWPDGSRYEGGWQNDKKHGQGTRDWADGYRYEGEWRGDVMHGGGTFFWSDGGSYTGEWRDGRKQGPGSRIWADGRRYEGEWQNDLMHGRGTMIRADGSRYEGDWRDGNRLVAAVPVPQSSAQQKTEARQARLAADNDAPDSGSPAAFDARAAEQGLKLTRAMRKQVQSCLKMQGFDPGPADGVFGPRTREAIRTWQAARGQGQAAGGYLAEMTLDALMAGCRVAENRDTESQGQSRPPAQQRQDRQQLQGGPNATPESAQATNYWTNLERRRQQEQRPAVTARPESELRRRAHRLAQERQAERTAAGSRGQTNRADEEALRDAIRSQAKPKNLAAIRRFLEKGVDPNAPDQFGRSAVHYAAGGLTGPGGTGPVLTLLLASGGNCCVADRVGDTPLHYAVAQGITEDSVFTGADILGRVQLLLARGADPNHRNMRGYTPLHFSARAGFTIDHGPDLIRALFRAGADGTLPAFDGNTPLHLAAGFPIHLDRGHGYHLFIQTVLEDSAIAFSVDTFIIRALLKGPVSLSALNDDGLTPLLEAFTPRLWELHLGTLADATDAMIQAGADPNAEGPDRRTPLLMLLDLPETMNTSPDTLNKFGEATALLETLLDGGADPDRRDRQGDTPLHAAIRKGWDESVIKALISGGADPCIRNVAEQALPIQLARGLGRSDIEALLGLYSSEKYCEEIWAAEEEEALGLDRTARQRIQSCLRTRGFDAGPADGLLGSRTREAIRAWQATLGRGQPEPTGYLVKDDLEALLTGCMAAPTPLCAGKTGSACWMETANQQGCYVWNPKLHVDETVTWSGNCVDGRAVGRGKRAWRWREGAVWKTGSDEGELRGGKTYHGHWVHRRSNGNVYEGPYVDGKRHGHWVESYADGNVWEGAYVNGERHGRFVKRGSGGEEWSCWRRGERVDRDRCGPAPPEAKAGIVTEPKCNVGPQSIAHMSDAELMAQFDRFSAMYPYTEDDALLVEQENRMLGHLGIVYEKCWLELANKPGCHMFQGIFDEMEGPGWGATAYGMGLIFSHIPEVWEVRWSGQCVNGVVQGQGTASLLRPPFEFDYPATFLDGKRHGPARFTMVHTIDCSVEGQYLNGLREGKWTFSPTEGFSSSPLCGGTVHYEKGTPVRCGSQCPGTWRPQAPISLQD